MEHSSDSERTLEEGVSSSEKTPISDASASWSIFSNFSLSPTLSLSKRAPITEKHATHLQNSPQGRFSRVWASMSDFIRQRKADLPRSEPSQFRTLRDCPIGYPNVAAFLDSDRAFMIYRRFGYLGSRLLLDKQDELSILERRLDRMDKNDFETRPKRLQTRDISDDDAAPRMELLAKIETTFREYASLLGTVQQLASLKQPDPWDYQSLVNYMDDEKPLIRKDSQWVRWKDDMITLRSPSEHAWLDSGIEHILKWCQTKLGARRPIEYFFCSPEDKAKSQENTVYYNRRRIERVSTSVIIFAILALLTVPIYILYHLVAEIGTGQSYAACIGVILVFTLLFSAVVTLCTKARRQEILAAAAGYCAVLVVFLSNVGHSGSQ